MAGRPSVALVLGGGGVSGTSWTAGLLAGLADAGAFDPAAADIVIGTSAGSVCAAVLRRSGVTGLLEYQAATSKAGGSRDRWKPDPERIVEAYRLWVASDEVTPETARRMGEIACRADCGPEESWVGLYSNRIGTGWPGGDLRICAVACDSGERVVFTAASGAPLERVVAASCTVPGFFPPPTIGGRRYFDGGVRTTTSADVVLEAGATTALVIAPLAYPESSLGPVAVPALERETAALREAGVRVEVILPSPRMRELAVNTMDPATIGPAFEAGRELAAAAAPRIAAAVGARATAG